VWTGPDKVGSGVGAPAGVRAEEGKPEPVQVTGKGTGGGGKREL
jgi:hypothetical protein